MPLITNNIVVGQPQQTQIQVTPAVTVPAPKAPAFIPAPVKVVSVNNEPTTRHDSIIVGGKQKTIAKSSTYLMDMITIEKI